MSQEAFGCITKLPQVEVLELTPVTLSVLAQQLLVALSFRFYRQAVFPRVPVPVPNLATILVNSPASVAFHSVSITNISFKGWNIDFGWLGCLKGLEFSFNSEANLAIGIEKFPLAEIEWDATLTTLPCITSK